MFFKQYYLGCLAHDRFREALPALERGRPVVVTCAGGYRSTIACSLLARAGVHAVNLTGGMAAWNEARLPLERTP